MSAAQFCVPLGVRKALLAIGKAGSSATRISTCSTASAGSQSEPESVSWDDGAPLAGQVWRLSQDPAGSRQVQAALEAAPSDEAREVLAEELHGHAVKAMKCPHANHVMKKCIALLRPEALQFIVDELLAREGVASQVARHRYACRILQLTLKKCPPSQTAELTEVLLRDAKVLACHGLGRYSIELLLEIGTEDQRYRLVRVIEQNMRSVSLSYAGGAVVHAALNHAASEDKVWIARAVLQDPEVLLALLNQRQGRFIALAVASALEGRERDRARALLSGQEHALSASEFGGALIEHLSFSDSLA